MKQETYSKNFVDVFYGDPLPNNNINFGLPPITSFTDVVVDEFNEPLPGVNLFLKSNPRIGTATNFDGKFHFENVPHNEIVVVSWQGLKKEYKANKLPSQIVFTTTDELDAVVVTALKKRNTLKYIGFGLLALAVIAVLGKSKTVKARI
jgi:hypothetical protein